jgi:ribosomal small subunit protein bTHX
MGKGDVKSKKGKRWRGSFGNTRPSKLKNAYKAGSVAAVASTVEVAEKPKAAKKKA